MSGPGNIEAPLLCCQHAHVIITYPSWGPCRPKVINHYLQVLTMVTLAFTFTGALAGLMGMNLYFAVAETPKVRKCTHEGSLLCFFHGTEVNSNIVEGKVRL